MKHRVSLNMRNASSCNLLRPKIAAHPFSAILNGGSALSFDWTRIRPQTALSFVLMASGVGLVLFAAVSLGLPLEDFNNTLMEGFAPIKGVCDIRPCPRVLFQLCCWHNDSRSAGAWCRKMTAPFDISKSVAGPRGNTTEVAHLEFPERGYFCMYTDVIALVPASKNCR